MRQRMDVSRCCCGVVEWLDIPFTPLSKPLSARIEDGNLIGCSNASDPDITTWDAGGGSTIGVAPVFYFPLDVPVVTLLKFRFRMVTQAYTDPSTITCGFSRPSPTPGTTSGSIDIKLHMYRSDYESYSGIALDLAASNEQTVDWLGVLTPDEPTDYFISPNIATAYSTIVALPPGPVPVTPELLVFVESTTVELTENVWHWNATGVNGAMYRYE